MKVFLFLICLVCFANAKTWLGRQPSDPQDILNIHIVAHTHDDVGWLKTVDEYYIGLNQSIQDAGVQYILDSVIDMLEQDPLRKFIYVEQAFFYRWWNEQSEGRKQQVRDLVAAERLVFINGGWVMNDEAATHYTAIIDQMSLGAQFIFDQFGKVNNIGWHIDPFGHSASHPALFAKMGFDAFFFSRIDYQDYALRNASKRMELVWRGLKSYGTSADMFTSVMYDGYGPPDGFLFSWANAIAINDDPRLFGNNIKERADLWAQDMVRRSLSFRTNNIMIAFGSDFQYQNANVNFKNMDKLIKYINANPYGLNMFYSTPAIYTQYVNKAGLSWEVKTDDFFPYADRAHAYWTGYFTSRAALKGMVRESTNILHAIDNFLSTSGLPFSAHFPTTSALDQIFRLAEAHAVAQHHDAVAGTEKKHVADDYALRLSVGYDQAFKTFNQLFARLLPKSQQPGAAQGQTTGERQLENPQVAAPTVQFCPLLNQSICDPLTQVTKGLVPVVMYNPLAWARQHWTRLPVPSAQCTVYDASGKAVSSQTSPNVDGSYDVVFQAALPPLGFATYFVSGTSKSGASPKPPKAEEIITKAYSSSESGSPNANVVLENSHVRLTWDSRTNKLASFFNKDSGINLQVTQDFVWYNASAGNNAASDQASGAYIFRPNGTEPFKVSSSAPTLSVVTGPLMQEVRQTWADWVQVTFRLYADATHVQVQSTIGEIPIADKLGKEVVVKYTTNINSDKAYYTDANGLEMQLRRVDWRPTWKLQVNEPVSDNYFPVNTAMFINDTQTTTQITLVTDRSRGGASLKSGEIEAMLHRRLLYDDDRGVNEALNQTDTIRTTDLMFVAPHNASARMQRPLAEWHNHPPVVMFASPVSKVSEWTNAFNTQWSPMANALPQNVRLETLKTATDGSVLLRLHHLYAYDEDAMLSQPVQVNVAKLFTNMQPLSMTEMILTGQLPLSDLHRLNWRTDDMAHGEDGSASWELPLAHDPSADPFTVTLTPMDIRTFRVRFVNL